MPHRQKEEKQRETRQKTKQTEPLGAAYSRDDKGQESQDDAERGTLTAVGCIARILHSLTTAVPAQATAAKTHPNQRHQQYDQQAQPSTHNKAHEVVHYLKEQAQLLLTNIFVLPPRVQLPHLQTNREIIFKGGTFR